MQTFYIKPVNQYESDGNELAQCMERTTICGWRRYSLILLMLLMALIGVSVTLGVVINEPRSKCFGKRIRSNGTYDPTQHCLTWSSNGVTSMPNGTCPNECDQELYNSHMTHSGRRLETLLDDYCRGNCETSIIETDDRQRSELIHICMNCCENPNYYNDANNTNDILACNAGKYFYDYVPSCHPSWTTYCNYFQVWFVPPFSTTTQITNYIKYCRDDGGPQPFDLPNDDPARVAYNVIQLYGDNCPPPISTSPD